jgi:tetratricopeptide (TPR) repeat protein
MSRRGKKSPGPARHTDGALSTPADESEAVENKPAAASSGRADGAALGFCALLAAGLIGIYGRTLSAPMLLDDPTSIVDNQSIRRLWPILEMFSPPNDAGVGGRPLLNASYAFNYAVGGTEVFGFHLVNILIHVLAAWTLFGILRRTLLRPTLATRFGSAATMLAFAISAFWACHPLQTESVTYISQRAESLMGLFYLITLYCFIRGQEVTDGLARRVWLSLSVVACAAGACTKEVIVTAPLVLILYDRTFFAGSFAASWRRNGLFFVAVAASLLPLSRRLMLLHEASLGFGVGFGGGVPWWAYGITECRVVVKYLALSVWPNPLVFDYGIYEPLKYSEVWPFVVAIFLLLAATLVALRRSPSVGFAASWFFLILSPASSVIPIAGDPMAESRMYLPLAAIAALAVLGVFAFLGRNSLPILAGLAVVLGLASARRNSDYSSGIAIWSDTVSKLPSNPRAQIHLGNALLDEPGGLHEAIARFKEAIRLDPTFAEAHDNLGYALNIEGRAKDATAEYREALRLKPDLADAHNNLGFALNADGKPQEAIVEFHEALRLKPYLAEAHNNLANTLATLPGHENEALAEYNEALRLDPNYPEAHYGLGNIWFNTPGHMDDAIAQYQEALRFKPELAEAHYSLGNIWFMTPERLNDAIIQYEEALRLKPDFANAHFGLAIALLKATGRAKDVEFHLREVLRLQPSNITAQQILDRLRGTRP